MVDDAKEKDGMKWKERKVKWNSYNGLNFELMEANTSLHKNL